jgi:two-component system sensor histidine kinase DesK
VAGGALPAEAETALAMVVREAVTNVQRHARARSAEVVLRAGGGGVVLRVSDDGRGGAIAPGNGMDGMRARIEALGGRLAVDSVRGRGTVVEAWLPLARSVEAPRPAGSGEAGP